MWFKNFFLLYLQFFDICLWIRIRIFRSGSGFSVSDPDFLADPDPEKRLIRTKGPGSETLKKDLNNFDNLSPLQLANVQTVHIKSPGWPLGECVHTVYLNAGLTSRVQGRGVLIQQQDPAINTKHYIYFSVRFWIWIMNIVDCRQNFTFKIRINGLF